MWNHYAHYESYFGVIAAGGVLHTLNLRLAADDIGYIAKHARDRF
jgi:fatty-acyl-CoA synthase